MAASKAGFGCVLLTLTTRIDGWPLPVDLQPCHGVAATAGTRDPQGVPSPRHTERAGDRVRRGLVRSLVDPGHGPGLGVQEPTVAVGLELARPDRAAARAH